MTLSFYSLQGGKRPPQPLSDDIYDNIFNILDGKTIPKRDRNKRMATSYRKIRAHKYKLSAVCDPMSGKHKRQIIYRGRIMVKSSEVKTIIAHFYAKSKGDGSCKLEKAIARHYVG